MTRRRDLSSVDAAEQDRVADTLAVPPALIGLLLLLVVVLATIFIIAAITIQTP